MTYGRDDFNSGGRSERITLEDKEVTVTCKSDGKGDPEPELRLTIGDRDVEVTDRTECRSSRDP